MNLSTARATGRAIEIAMKKVVGSGKRVIVFSLLSESVFLALVSYVLAVALVFIVLDLTTFNQLINKNLRPDFFSNRLLLFGSLGLAVGVGILSGLYSAFYLPSMPTLAALKGAFRNSKASHSFRRFLITAQFAISIFVVVCTLFMSEQVNYMRNKDLGFNKENILVLAINDTLVKKQVPAIKNEMLRNPNILSATTVHAVMGMNIGTGVMLGESDTGMRQQGGMGALSVGEDFLKTMDITLLSGRDFQRGEKIDLEGVYIANESAVRAMGWGDDALGKKVSFFHGQNPGKVIGVVKDFNSSSLHQPAEPMFILKANWFNGYLQLRVSGKDLPQTIEYVREKWTTFDPNHPFEYFFLDQRFNEQYKADETQNKLLSVLSFICIFISLLGLIGLSAFTATQRTKEIGVRKVLGANISDIILLLSKESLLLVVVSSVLIIPLSWWVVNLWLENFAYRMELNYFLYGAVTILALGFVFLTVLFQSLKTARSNPVDSLKYE
ncbi:MAG: FtsX-like permease family protein [Bacteroidota bacterium]